jgi:hypothetical protein
VFTAVLCSVCAAVVAALTVSVAVLSAASASVLTPLRSHRCTWPSKEAVSSARDRLLQATHVTAPACAVMTRAVLRSTKSQMTTSPAARDKDRCLQAVVHAPVS